MGGFCPYEVQQHRFYIRCCLEKTVKQFLNNADFLSFPIKKCNCKEFLTIFYQPSLMKRYFESNFKEIDKAIVCGTFENRVTFLSSVKSDKQLLLSFKTNIEDNSYIKMNRHFLNIKNPKSWISLIETSSPSFFPKLERPHTLLIGLSHPENFPRPRFALGISDIAGAIREEFMGRVTLLDMQLGKTVQDIHREILYEKPDIIGISVTFGQQDILELLLNLIMNIPRYLPIVVVGGSLAALNSKKLLSEYPNIFIALGPGEQTVKDIIRYWYGENELVDVDNILFRKTSGQFVKTAKTKESSNIMSIPELDLLPSTLSNRGVLQLESTRGCFNACSFCPRSHKGRWYSQSLDLFEKLFPEINFIYKTYPEITKKVFLVDEEFIGYRSEDETISRVKNLCHILKKYNFTFETNARIDQVYRLDRDKQWHIGRINLWKYLTKNGLDRVLFGVESGVDSVLERFNKNTISLQNKMAIRMLTLCNIPIRLTYITFDPLMSLEELIKSFIFQGRKDLLLKPNLELTSEEIFDCVHDEEYVFHNSQQQRLYRMISYPLVSLECFLGSKYLQDVGDLDLIESYNFSMGKCNVKYEDARIGLISYNAQLWVDRNFSLDYTLKSFEKIYPLALRSGIREVRMILRDSAYSLFAKFLALITRDFSLIPTDLISDISDIKNISTKWDSANIFSSANQLLFKEIMNKHFVQTVNTLDCGISSLKNKLQKPDVKKLEEVCDVWMAKTEWTLINT